MKKNIVVISGSLRSQSYNKKLAVLATEFLSKDKYNLTFLDFSKLPHFNEDLEKEKPKEVDLFIKQIKEGDGFIFVTPEYNNSIPGSLKNAIDWASRSRPSVLSNKPAVIMSTSLGSLGGIRAQLHLREILTCLRMDLVLYPEVVVSNAFEAFQNKPSDKTLELIEKLIRNFENKLG